MEFETMCAYVQSLNHSATWVKNLRENKATIMKHLSYTLQLEMAELGSDVASSDGSFIHMLCST